MGAFLRQSFTDTHLTAAGLLIFFAFFVTVCVWVYGRKSARGHYDAMGRMPLEKDGQ